MITKTLIEDVISRQLEDRTFEEVLEDFDLTPEEVFWVLFTNGLIDQELFGSIYDSY
jgi:uncharacterized protein (DUF433 family)